MPTIPELIAQWRDKTVDGFGLMRGLISYGQWEAPISEKAVAAVIGKDSWPALQLSSDKEGRICLLLFSSPAAFGLYRGANADAAATQHFVTMPGRAVFASPMEAVDRICIDPLSPHDIIYEKEQFKRLRECAAAIAVEEALSGLRRGQAKDGAIPLVRDYRGYSLAVAQHEGRPRLLMAPDQQGRSLAAIFTADDAFDAFRPEAKAQTRGSEVQQLAFEGRALFELLQGMQLDGFVFNCAGPGAPVAFAAGVAKIVLEG